MKILIIVALLTSNISLADEHSGRWVGECITKSSNRESSVTETEFTLKDKLPFTVITVLNYLGANCEELGYIATTNGTYTSVDGTFDFKVESKVITIKHEKFLEIFNFYGLCNQRNWQLNVPIDVSNTEQCGFEPGMTRYDIYKILDGKLYFGIFTDEYNGTTAARRPRMINEDLPYTRGMTL